VVVLFVVTTLFVVVTLVVVTGLTSFCLTSISLLTDETLPALSFTS
jgi:hypothetical protein